MKRAARWAAFFALVALANTCKEFCMALNMRPGCERCDRDLPADQPGALICSFECNFCTQCNDDALHGTCPNYGGPLVPRPQRKGAALDNFPASTKRVYKGV